ncbi:hypothetical protein [Roseisolibacter agri]|uniref:Septum formation initiator n=1 Tax=Roseisolibacter agri TaxID=2014610 RepID=A0AA37QER9_9BACT|nr:hypothetical protein [Roseisolibacter agri]GLC25428.1 hypothetical protein rosag_19410 [Roseisolibacter agri]
MHAPPYEPYHASPERPRDRSPIDSVLRSPRGRPLLLALGALLLLLLIAVVWYGNPENRARRELTEANARIVEKQREVDDARRLLEQRLVELRAVRAQADVQATVYRGVLEREGRPVVRDTMAVGGEVVLPPVADPNTAPAGRRTP